MKQFQISTRNSGRKRTIQICVYDTVEEMRQAGLKHSNRVGSGETGFDRAWGLTQSSNAIQIYESGAIRRSVRAGYIRLIRKACQTGIIAHESTHMAIAIYQQDVQRTIPDMEREEKLCYLVGDITSQIVKGLYKYELIPN